MAFDQNSVPKDLRVLNVAPIMVEETLISPASVTSPPTPDSASDYFYPASASASATWCVRPIVSPPSIGLNYGSGFGNRVMAGNALNLGNWVGTSTSSNNNNNSNNALHCNDGVNVNVSGFSYGGHGGNRAVDDAGDDSNSGRKVKFLCSFGGKILPRPSDGVLRYVGGQTRIISVRRDVSFNDLVQKMVDTYGQPVVIKYQLPEEDLDALVSIACPDDVENMMEEYGKLVERSPDGSAKLRVFLFPMSEVDISSAAQVGDLQDTGQKYFDAVNGIVDVNGVSVGFKRKESVTSAASTQNSDLSGIETIDSSLAGQGDSSPCMLSPREYVATSPDTNAHFLVSESSTPVYSGASPVSFGTPVTKTGPTYPSYMQNEIELEKPVPVTLSQQPFELHQSRMEIPSSPYLNHGEYVHLPPQMGFPNPHLLGKTGPVFAQQQFHSNASGLAYHQAIPGAQMTMTQPSSRLGIRPNLIQPQPLIQTQHNHLNQYSDENTSGIRIVQLPSEHNYNTYQFPVNQVPVNQVPSVIVGGNRGWVQVPPQQHEHGLSPQQQVINSEQILRAKGCSMCQKKLPHAHSDPVVQDQHDGISGPVPDSRPSYNSFPLEDTVKAQATKRVESMVASPLKEGIVEQGYSTRPSVISNLKAHNGARPCTDNTVISHNFEPQNEGGMIFIQNPKEFDHPMNSCIQETIGRIGEKHSSGDGLGATGTPPSSYPDDVVRQHTTPVEIWVKQDDLVNKHVNNDIPRVDGTPIHTSECSSQGSPKEYTNELTGVISKSDAVDNWIRQGYLRPVDGRNDTLKINMAEGYVGDDQCLLPVDKSLDYNSQIAAEEEVILDNNFGTSKLIVDANKIKMIALQPCSSKETSFRHNSRIGEYNDVVQSPVLDVTQSKILNHHKDDSTSSTSSPSFLFGDMQDSPNSVFGNQDPWNIQHGTFFQPSVLSKVTSEKETYFHKDYFGENPGTYKKSNLDAQLDGDLYESFKHNGWCDKGSTEDQQLKVVAEDVAASVLHPCVPSNPNLQAEDVSCQKNIEDGIVQNNLIHAKCRDITQDVKSNLPEKGNFGFPTSGVGRLQIIKNCDLEELTELGSGTFGTVYHGKWRGTDVAIKRITDRCFAGKPSEQERMRDDFWNEAIKLADLHHPNVVAFYGVVLDGPGDSVATVTEYMTNGSLRNALQKNERNLDKRRRLMIAMDVAFGMEYLHGKNIVHFDLKSDNLLVNLRDPHRPICKVGDLGLSKVKCQTLISGGVRGTLPWMAPELLNGSSSLVSEKVDVFSFGIVMWELLTGNEPYADLHYGAIIGGIVSNTLRPSIPESCDPEWCVLMERCWASEPSERPNFTDIADELRSMATKRQNQQLQPSHLHTQINK
ncbi:kinase superfamily with octicosapeptide/Phox/Bem1p domain-containing protein [Trifolium repens]|nr:kinase superfamily with octicosapeptide/Phox/Bem1p domain-containing protein [Trifolium repens]